MKTAGIIMLLLGVGFGISRFACRIIANNEYKQKIGSNWELADRASTIEQKQEYINKYVNALEGQAALKGEYNALYLLTPEDSFDENLKAVKSLQKRLNEISGMNPNSFEYQTAIHQITEQEQGESSKTTTCLYECWKKVNHYTLWNDWFFWGFVTIQLALIFLGYMFIVE